MSPYNSLTSRTDTGALIPEDVSREIIKGTTERSMALQLFRHHTMSRAQQRIPVLSVLPYAYWVQGDTGLKQTSEVNWTNKYLDAEELAVIVPIPEKVLDDVDYDLWAEIKPLLEEAIAMALDDAIFFGTNKPASWPNDVVTTAVAAGNTYTEGESGVDLAEDINQAMMTVEDDGFGVSGFVCRAQFKGKLRGLRDANRNFLYTPDGPAETSASQDTVKSGQLYGSKAYFHKGGLAGFATGAGKAHLICGDFQQGIVGIRQDLTFKMLDQAVIQDNTGAIVYNLPQQDMVAMRVVARFAFQVPNPVTRMKPVEADRYGFAVLKQA